MGNEPHDHAQAKIVQRYAHLVARSGYAEESLAAGALASALVFSIHKLDEVHRCLYLNPVQQFRASIKLRCVLVNMQQTKTKNSTYSRQTGMNGQDERGRKSGRSKKGCV